MKRIVIALLSITVLLATSFIARADHHEQSAAPKPEVIGLLFYADWCGSCKVLEPKLDALKKDFADKPILFTRVDMTDDFTKSQSKLFAGALDLGAIYGENAPKTGYMLLINPDDKKVLGKLVKTQSEDEIKADIGKALASAMPGGSTKK